MNWVSPSRRFPFMFFDHMGPADFAPGLPPTVDVRPHRHIGLSTVTYLLEGEITQEAPLTRRPAFSNSL